MKVNVFLLSFIVFAVLCSPMFSFDGAEAYKTSGYNFCQAFPLFPECVGWRTDPISDSYNYWFCAHVDLPKLCEDKPIPEKQIVLRDQEFCCRYIGDELKIRNEVIQDNSSSKQLLGSDSPDTSIRPLIVWTDKDHYNFKDKVIVYGKFDFSSWKIKKSTSEVKFDQALRIVNGTSIQTGRIIAETPVLDVDIILNGRTILKNVPVNENGWFAAFFHLNDRYHFSNQNNLLGVEYISYEYPIPHGGPRTQSTYHFTTGDIAKNDEKFEVWIDDSALPNKIRYGVNLDNPERFINLTRYDLVIARLVTPQGFVIPLDTNFSVKDLSKEFSEFSEYGHGTYEIQVTYGHNTAKATFDY